VGQHFVGDTQPYLPANTHRFEIDLAGATIPVAARIGDIPALDQAVTDTGLAIVAHVSNDFTLEYGREGLFESFLAYEGLTPMLAEHRRRGLPMTGFKERYQRFAKALVQVGDRPGSDRRLGLAFEWVLQSNPYLSSQRPLRARLYWRGEPLAGVQARLFVNTRGEVDERVVTTDREGGVELVLPSGSEAMLNAVQLRELPESSGAVWKSYWSSISFALP
ncbi:MAG: DUF4198 domain-containing protein, partial [Gammaproteobacteria bacterium]|nr:DUF4198 domain-containing protein [Gammaproteobacteria bacterium]